MLKVKDIEIYVNNIESYVYKNIKFLGGWLEDKEKRVWKNLQTLRWRQNDGNYEIVENLQIYIMVRIRSCGFLRIFTHKDDGLFKLS